MKKTKPNNDSSPSFKYIWKLSWPIILANLTIPIVTATDTAVMGYQLDPKYIAGVALGGIIFNFVYAGFNFFRMMTTGLVAQAYGAQRQNELHELVFTTAFSALICGFVICLISIPLTNMAKFFLDASNESEALMGYYVLIRVFESPAALVNMVLLGTFFGIGAPRAAMVQLIVISLTNVAFDLFFVMVLGLKIEGVAYASVLAQWFGLLISFYILYNLLKVNLFVLFNKFSKLIFDNTKRILKLFNLSKDLFLRTICIITVEVILINFSAKIGDEYAAASQICIVILGFIAFSLDGFAHALEALIGQAIGKKEKKRILIKIMIKTILMAFIFSIFISIIIWIFGSSFFGFMTTNEDILLINESLKPILIVLPLVSIWPFMFDGIFIGCTESKPMRNSTMLALFSFIVLIYFFVYDDQNIRILWICFLIYLLLRSIYLSFYFNNVFKKAL